MLRDELKILSKVSVKKGIQVLKHKEIYFFILLTNSQFNTHKTEMGQGSGWRHSMTP